MLARIGLFFILLLLLACQHIQRAPKPEKLLSQEQMQDILTDLILLDAVISVNNYQLDNYNIDAPHFIFNKYDIDSITLAQNLDYYNEQYTLNAEMYENVKLRIEAIKNEVEQQKALQDSLLKEERKALKIKDTLLKKSI